MGTQTIVSGRIILTGDVEESVSYLRSLNDTSYPWIRKEHFGLEVADTPFYYENPVVGFAASYKGLEYDWGSFMLKFENVLRHIAFENARLQMEAEHSFEGYVCTWISKQTNSNLNLQQDKLYVTDEWYFGYGYRGRWGMLNEDLQDYQVYAPYPLAFDKDILDLFNNKMLEHVNTASEKVYYLDLLRKYSGNDNIAYDKFSLIQTYLDMNKEAEFGHVPDEGFWMKRLKHIEPLTDTKPR